MTTNIVDSFNAWLRKKQHQTIYELLIMHMDTLLAMLDNSMHGIEKLKSVVVIFSSFVPSPIILSYGIWWRDNCFGNLCIVVVRDMMNYMCIFMILSCFH